MEVRQALRIYHARLKLEAVIRAFFFAACAALLAGIVLIIAAGFSPERLGRTTALCALLVVFAICLPAIYFLRLRPTLKQTGLRVDSLGLGERVATAVEFAQSDSAVCVLQRQDALEWLKTVQPSQIKLRWPVHWMVLCVVLFVVMLGVMSVPQIFWQNLHRPQETVQPAESEEMQLVRQQLSAIEALIEGADLSDEDKTAYYARLQTIEEAMSQAGELNLLMLSQIMQETNALLTELEGLQKLSPIVDELKKTVIMKELAEAISSRTETRIKAAMKNLKECFLATEGEKRIEQLCGAAQEIETALLNVPGGMTATLSSDFLCYCFRSFAEELRTIATAIAVGLDGTEEIEDMMQTMENRLVLMLSAEKNKDSLNLTDGSVLDEEEGRGTVKVFGQATGGGQGTLSADQIAQMLLDGTIDPESLEQERFGQSDTVYEPTMDVLLGEGDYEPGKKNRDGSVQREVVGRSSALFGTVAYEKVYGMYFADVLDQLSDLPAEEREQMENYYYGMIQGAESRTKDE